MRCGRWVKSRRPRPASRRALELDANQCMALARLAQISANRGSYPEARVWAERALALAPGYPDAALSLAAADLGERKTAEAEARVRGLAGRYAAHRDGSCLRERVARRYLRCHESTGRCRRGLYDLQSNAAKAQRWTICRRERRPAIRARDGPSFRARTPRPVETAAARRAPIDREPGVWSSCWVFRDPARRCWRSFSKGTRTWSVSRRKESLIDSVREFMQRPEDLDRLAGASSQTLEVFSRRVLAACRRGRRRCGRQGIRRQVPAQFAQATLDRAPVPGRQNYLRPAGIPGTRCSAVSVIGSK